MGKIEISDGHADVCFPANVGCVSLCPTGLYLVVIHIRLRSGALKSRDLTSRELTTRHHIARVDIARLNRLKLLEHPSALEKIERAER